MIGDLYRQVQAGEDDRAEAEICRWQVRVRLVRLPLSHRLVLRLEYRSEYWPKSWGWTQTQPRDLAEMLVKYAGAHRTPEEIEAARARAYDFACGCQKCRAADNRNLAGDA